MLNKLLVVIRAGNFSVRQIGAMLVVYRLGPSRHAKIVRELQISGPALSRALDSLGVAGLTRRVREDDDLRQVRVHLTDKGTNLMRRITA